MNTKLDEYIKTLTGIRDGKPWEVRLPCGEWVAADPERDPMHISQHEVRLKPWTLGRSVNGFTLSDGQEWHRQDFTEDMLPEGWRPLLDGEHTAIEDNYFMSGEWAIRLCKGDVPMDIKHLHHRTRRPLPVADPLADPLADRKAAHAAGQTIQRRVQLSSETIDIQWSKWADVATPSWTISSDVEWRIKPAPVMVPLGPEDVPPGSVIRLTDSNERVEWMPTFPVDTGVEMPSEGKWSYLSFIDMRDNWQINRSIPLAGRWDKDAWQPCEKEEVQP